MFPNHKDIEFYRSEGILLTIPKKYRRNRKPTRKQQRERRLNLYINEYEYVPLISKGNIRLEDINEYCEYEFIQHYQILIDRMKYIEDPIVKLNIEICEYMLNYTKRLISNGEFTHDIRAFIILLTTILLYKIREDNSTLIIYYN